MKRLFALVAAATSVFFAGNSYAQTDEREPGLYAIVGEESVPLAYTNGTVHSSSTGILGVEFGKKYCTYKGASSGVVASSTFVMVIDPEKKAITRSMKAYNPFIKTMTPNNVLVLPLSVDKDKRVFEEGKSIAGINISVKDRMDFEWEQISDNSFEIRVLNLIPGEYGFVFRPAKLGEFDYSGLLGFTIPEETPVSCANQSESPKVFMSYNVRNGIGMDDQRLYSRPADVIKEYAPDIVALQELDRGTNRAGGADVISEIARLTDMTATYAKAIDFNGGEYGVGLLSKTEPVRTGSVSLPGREERRVLLMAEFEEYIFCSTHLSLTEEDRLASIDIIEDALREFSKGLDKPVYIAGDWNDTPDSETLSRIREHFVILSDTESFTFPADEPRTTIDYIAVWKENGLGPDVKTSKALTAPDCVSSDHRPVVIVLQ